MNYRNRVYPGRPAAQRGAVLIIALVFLLLITLLGINSSQTSMQQLLMAGNEQERVEAIQRAQTLVDAILDDSDNTPLTGTVGYKICKINIDDISCHSKIIDLDNSILDLFSGGTLSYHVIRKGPLTAPVPPLNEELASSSSAYQVATMEVDTTYDGSASRKGTSSIVQGILVLVPTGQQ